MLRALSLSGLSVLALYFALIAPVGDVYEFLSSKLVAELQQALNRD